MPLTRFLETDDSTRSLFQRAALAAIVAAHGAQKLLGWFGGWGFDGAMRYFTDDVGVPAAVAFLIILLESLGMVALAAGFLTRLMAGSISLVMLGAIVLADGKNGFFLNWGGVAGRGEGIEFHLLVLALAIPLAFTGAGALSVDRWLSRRLVPTSAAPALASSRI